MGRGENNKNRWKKLNKRNTRGGKRKEFLTKEKCLYYVIHHKSQMGNTGIESGRSSGYSRSPSKRVLWVTVMFKRAH
jgi:hypothetical protein